MAETVEDIDARIAELRAQKRAARLIEHQQKTLLPRLKRAKAGLDGGIDGLSERRKLVVNAISQIEDGVITDFRLRRPPTRKAKPKAEGG